MKKGNLNITSKIPLKNLIVLGFLYCLFSSFWHLIKLTSSMVSYNDKVSKLSIECRVFIDDFEDSVNKKLTTNINVSKLDANDKLALEVYFNSHYIITLNGKQLRLKFEAEEVMASQNMLKLKFFISDFFINEGDDIVIENKLFLDEFGALQENIISMVFPPYFAELNYKTNINNYTFSYSF